HSLSALARRFLPFQTVCGDASSYKRLTALPTPPTQESSLDHHTLHTLFEMIPQLSRQAMRPAFRAIQRRTLMGGHPTGPTYSEESLRTVPFSFKNKKVFATTLVSFLGLGLVGLPTVAWAWTWYKPGGFKNASG
ncbi:hypothetical protein EV122DRAFT_260773, partial [Schizophyllum commune]